MLSLTDIVSPLLDHLTGTKLPSEETAPLLGDVSPDWCGHDFVDEDGWVKFDTYSRNKMDEFGKIQEFVGLELEELKRLDGQEWIPLPTVMGFRKAYGYIFIGEDEYDDLSDFA